MPDADDTTVVDDVEEEEQTVDRGHDQSRDEQRHLLDDAADDESGQGRPDHTTRQEPPGEGRGSAVRGWRARGDRHGGDCAGTG